jgi:plastocyanin
VNRTSAITGFICLVATMLPSHAFAQGMEDVAIRDYRFQPAELKIRIGATVRWTNQEKRTSHSVLFLPPLNEETERLFPGESWQRKFDQPGTYPYRCGPHPEMTGVVEVTE